MNQIVSMLQASNKRAQSIANGRCDPEKIVLGQREAEVQIKIINSVISIFGIQSKNKRALKSMQNMNIMDDTTAVDLMLGDPEVDKVKCPINGIISRAECLDYSGSHMDECEGCDIGAETKRVLIDEAN